MIKQIVAAVAIVCLVAYHLREMHTVRKAVALDILDALRLAELDVKADTVDESTGIMYFSPPKYAKRTAIMDCEQLVYERYRLWE